MKGRERREARGREGKHGEAWGREGEAEKDEGDVREGKGGEEKGSHITICLPFLCLPFLALRLRRIALRLGAKQFWPRHAAYYGRARRGASHALIEFVAAAQVRRLKRRRTKDTRTMRECVHVHAAAMCTNRLGHEAAARAQGLHGRALLRHARRHACTHAPLHQSMHGMQPAPCCMAGEADCIKSCNHACMLLLQAAAPANTTCSTVPSHNAVPISSPIPFHSCPSAPSSSPPPPSPVPASHPSLTCSRENSFSANSWGSCSRCRAAKLSVWLSLPLRSAFFTVATTRCSLACFLRLLERVPYSADERENA